MKNKRMIVNILRSISLLPTVAPMEKRPAKMTICDVGIIGEAADEAGGVTR